VIVEVTAGTTFGGPAAALRASDFAVGDQIVVIGTRTRTTVTATRITKARAAATTPPTTAAPSSPAPPSPA
jgi:hypothetical protein